MLFLYFDFLHFFIQIKKKSLQNFLRFWCTKILNFCFFCFLFRACPFFRISYSQCTSIVMTTTIRFLFFIPSQLLVNGFQYVDFYLLYHIHTQMMRFVGKRKNKTKKKEKNKNHSLWLMKRFKWFQFFFFLQFCIYQFVV